MRYFAAPVYWWTTKLFAALKRNSVSRNLRLRKSAIQLSRISRVTVVVACCLTLAKGSATLRKVLPPSLMIRSAGWPFASSGVIARRVA